MHQGARTFAPEAAERHDFEVTVEEFPEGTKTAADVDGRSPSARRT